MEKCYSSAPHPTSSRPPVQHKDNLKRLRPCGNHSNTTDDHRALYVTKLLSAPKLNPAESCGKECWAEREREGAMERVCENKDSSDLRLRCASLSPSGTEGLFSSPKGVERDTEAEPSSNWEAPMQGTDVPAGLSRRDISASSCWPPTFPFLSTVLLGTGSVAYKKREVDWKETK